MQSNCFVIGLKKSKTDYRLIKFIFHILKQKKSMQKIIIKAWLSADQPASEIANNERKTLTQRVRIIEPAHTDQWGEKKGEDQQFEVLFFNEKAKALPDIKQLVEQITEDKPMKVQVTCYLNGNKRQTEDGKEFYNCYLAGTELKGIE